MNSRSEEEISTEYNKFSDRTNITVADMSAISLRLILEVMLDVRKELVQLKDYMIYKDLPR